MTQATEDHRDVRTNLRHQHEAQWRSEAKDFVRRFPTIRNDDSPDLTITWAEIERQFLDLSATWDRMRARAAIREAREMSDVVSGEQAIRWLMIIAHSMSTFDTPRPAWMKSLEPTET